VHHDEVTDEELEELISEVTVDCYGDEERAGAFHAVLTDHTQFPVEATLLGIAVTVHEFDTGDSGLTARCTHGKAEQWLSLADLRFPPETPTAWVHAAYRYDLGLDPYPSAMPEGWTLDDI